MSPYDSLEYEKNWSLTGALSPSQYGQFFVPKFSTSIAKLAAGNLPASLPPSVEQAYRKKCIDLKRRMTEVEESNDAFRLRKVRLTRAIRKMRLERAYLLETLGKRMKKNGTGGDELQGYFDEESEGSSEGPPTPHEKPLRSKRSHRRNVASPPLALDSNISHANPQYQAPAFNVHAYEPRRSSQQSHTMQSPTDGQPEFQHYRPPEATQSNLQTHPMVSPLPPPTAFQIYADQRHLSSPQNQSGKQSTSQAALMKQAEENWENESEGVRQLFLLQEVKAKETYEKQVAAAREYEMQQQQTRADAPEEEKAESSERDLVKVEGERMEVDNEVRETEAAEEGAEPAGGFTSINV